VPRAADDGFAARSAELVPANASIPLREAKLANLLPVYPSSADQEQREHDDDLDGAA
jgi:hypothetical protein